MKAEIPKDIRGIRFPGYIKINRTQARKWLESGQAFKGFLVGNKVAPFHFFQGWRLAAEIEVSDFKEFETHFNNFTYYLDSELGSGVSIYLGKP